METLNLKMDVDAIRAAFRACGQDNVTNEEIETVMRACLTQYVKDGWVTEVLVAELRQLREDPETYKKDANLA
jgi:hypothetical protein